MLLRDKEIPELFEMKHRHDNFSNYVNYEDNILNNSLSPHIFNNNLMNSFLDRIKKVIVIMYDQHNIVKNFKNYIVDKYEYKHSR